jgi:hypothetical protein
MLNFDNAFLLLPNFFFHLLSSLLLLQQIDEQPCLAKIRYYLRFGGPGEPLMTSLIPIPPFLEPPAIPLKAVLHVKPAPNPLLKGNCLARIIPVRRILARSQRIIKAAQKVIVVVEGGQ